MSPPPKPSTLWTVHLPTAAWWVLTTFALAAPSDTADLPAWWPRILHFQALDKVVHGLLFAVAALLLARSLHHLRPVSRPLLAALLVTVLYGGATEVGQHFFTDRSGELADVAADVLGAGLGTLAATRLRSPEASR